MFAIYLLALCLHDILLEMKICEILCMCVVWQLAHISPLSIFYHIKKLQTNW